jgi:hypothetical protein
MIINDRRILEAISKIHLTPNYGVADLLKMLTYSRVCSAFSSARALSLNVIKRCVFGLFFYFCTVTTGQGACKITY